jgi:RNA recognition motif-containing protein
VGGGGGEGAGAGGEGRRQRGGPSSGPGGVRDQPWENRVYMGNLPFEIEAEDIAAFFREKVS